MREKIVPAVFLMLVLLIGFPSSVGDFGAFGDKDNDNLFVSSEKFEDDREDTEKVHHQLRVKQVKKKLPT